MATYVETIMLAALELLENNGLINGERRLFTERLYFATELLPSEEGSCCLFTPELKQGDPVLHTQLILGTNHPTEYKAYILFHELAHLIACGRPERHGNVMLLPWGICHTIYYLDDKEVVTSCTIDPANLRKKNEQLNDVLAIYLYDALEKVQPLPDRIRMYKRGKYADMNQEQLIRQYLAHQSPP